MDNVPQTRRMAWSAIVAKNAMIFPSTASYNGMHDDISALNLVCGEGVDPAKMHHPGRLDRHPDNQLLEPIFAIGKVHPGAAAR